MALSIRLARPSDAPVLARLNRVVQGLHVEQLPARFKEATDEEVTGWFASMLSDDFVRIVMAEESGEAVGYIVTRVVERKGDVFSLPRKSLEIDQLAVDLDRQQQGIGRALIQHVIDTAHASGISDVLLTCWSFNNNAQEAFRRCGFEAELIRFRYTGNQRRER